MKRTVLFLCMILFSFGLFAQESTKTYEKAFSSDGIEELVIKTSYGRIEVIQGTGNEIKVEVEMKVSAKSGLKADETLELIQINETRAGNYINLETMFGKDMTFAQTFTSTSVYVDYVVTLPKDIKLRLITSNIAIFTGDFDGVINADIRNGDFKGGKITGEELYVYHDKGNFTVDEVNVLNGEFKNCNISVGDAKKIKITTSNGCTGKFDAADRFNIRSTGGTMALGEIDELTGSSSYTKYEVQDLGSIMDMDMKMGEMNVRNVHKTFSEIRLKGSFTKVGLTFMEDAGYHLELKRNKSLKVDLPRGIEMDERPTSKKNVTIGNRFFGNTNYSGKVFLELSNGSLYIQ